MIQVENDPRSRYSDYSCVTPLETLSNDIELLFRKWVTRDQSTKHHWKELRTCSSIGEVRIEFYSIPSNSFVCEDDTSSSSFSQRFVADRTGSSAAHLCEWFGLTQCVCIFITRESSLLRGWSSSPHPSPSNKAKASSALSALILAGANGGIQNLPMFGVVLADISGSSRFGPYDVVQGYMCSEEGITRMECDQRNQVTARYRRLNGMVELFDARMKNIDKDLDISKAKISARHCYAWEPSMWGMRSEAWRMWPLKIEGASPSGVRWLQQVLGSVPESNNPIHRGGDPISLIQALAVWPPFRCGSKMETTSHSTLRRHDASVQLQVQWSAKWDTQCPLAAKCLFLLASLVHGISLESKVSVAPLALTDLMSKPNLTATYQSVGIDPDTSLKVAGSLSNKVKEACRLLIAPRAAPPADSELKCSSEISSILCTQLQGHSDRCLWNWIPSSAPVGRLVSLFAWKASSLDVLTGKAGIAHWWVELLAQVRASWDAVVPIVSLGRYPYLDHTPPVRLEKTGRPSHLVTHHPAEPDLQLGILSQKLQVIDLCICSLEVTRNSIDDEFTDCDWSETTDGIAAGEGPSVEEEAAYASCDEEVFNSPQLQPLAPMTSDSELMVNHMLHQMKPGDLAFAQIQKQLRLSSLLADIHAFQKANPSAKYSNFVDWYCPSTVDDEGIYSESELQSAWESGGSGKLLFNRPSEAEKSLHFLETLPVSTALIQILIGLIPTCMFALTCGVVDLLKAGDLPLLQSTLTAVEDEAKSVVTTLSQVYPAGSIPQAMLVKVESFIVSLSRAEALLEKATSLLYRFPGCFDLVNSLLFEPAVKITQDQKLSVFTFFDDEYRKSRTEVPLKSGGDTQTDTQDEAETEEEAQIEDNIGGTDSTQARPTEREYIIKLQSGQTSLRMGCLVNEADTFPTTRAVRITLREEVPDICNGY